jgi:hypothetical protein
MTIYAIFVKSKLEKMDRIKIAYFKVVMNLEDFNKDRFYKTINGKDLIN